jgi:hypothetical protein
MVRLRRAAGEGFWASLLDCFCCLSLWLALPFALLLDEDLTERLLLWPALSAGAIILERINVKQDILPLLRHEQDTTEGPQAPARRVLAPTPATDRCAIPYRSSMSAIPA